ncbi:MAG: hypothetical protein NTY64_10945, partial [Deltaproteobacteria bacterium]|nr:hypothetical protein [Deltaproteobacteria bacterium]
LHPSSLRKVGAARRAARDRATRRVAPTIGFARLASGAFYEAINIVSDQPLKMALRQRAPRPQRQLYSQYFLGVLGNLCGKSSLPNYFADRERNLNIITNMDRHSPKSINPDPTWITVDEQKKGVQYARVESF